MQRHEADRDRLGVEDEDQAPVPAVRFAPEEEAVSFMRAVCPISVVAIP